MKRSLLALLFGLSLSACIATSIVDPNERARVTTPNDQAWKPASAENIPGVYVSTEVSGALSNVLRKVVYLFEANGNYTGSALVNSTPPHFEVIAGNWSMDGSQLALDDAEPAQAEVSESRSLRFSGEQGRVTLRRELSQ